MPLLLIIIAAMLYGLLDSFATLSWYNPVVAVALIDGMQGLVLLAYGWRRWPKQGISFRHILLLVVLQSGSVILFLTAIGLAPIAPVVAIFLSTPIIYLLWDVANGRRQFGFHELFLLLLLAVSIFLAGLSREGGGSEAIWLGIVLALIAAIGNACGMALIARWSKQQDIRLFAGFRSLLTFAILLPVVLVISPSPEEVSWYLAMGFIAAPATAAVWWAVGRMQNTLWSSAGLSQSIWAALWAFFLWNYSLTPLAIVSSLFIVLAIVLEQRRGRLTSKNDL